MFSHQTNTGPSRVFLSSLLVCLALHSLALSQESATREPATATVESNSTDIELLRPYAELARQWDSHVNELVQLDQKEVAGPDSVLFLGSSSIRLWHSIEEDMKPWKVVRRGYGGAKFCDLAIHLPRLIEAHQPSKIAIFVGNDISGRPDLDKTPAEIVKLFDYVQRTIRENLPKTEIYLIEITPTGSRFHLWEKIRDANQALREFCDQNEGCQFIETAAAYLDSEGKPREELFTDDRLHQNQAGYRLWGQIISRSISSD